MNEHVESLNHIKTTAIALAMQGVLSNVVDYGPAEGEINKAIVEAFRSRNIVIPFPQYEVRMLGNAA